MDQKNKDSITKPNDSSTITNNKLDIYSHIKHNIAYHAKNCTEPLSQNSFYCFTCKHSVCDECGLNSDHKGKDNHHLIQREKYLKYNPAFFDELDKALINSLILDDKKRELKSLVSNSINQLQKKLEDIQMEKMAQIDSFFKEIQSNLNQIKLNFDSVKETIENYHKQNETFFNETSNNDQENMIFLMNYEMMSLCENKNNEVIRELKGYEDVIEAHKEVIDERTKKAIKDIEHYLDFEYSLSKVDDYYKDVFNRTNKYNEHIQAFKKSIYDIVKTQGSFDRLNELVEVFDSKNQRGVDLLLNQDYFLANSNGTGNVNGTNRKTMKVRGSMRASNHTITQSKSGTLNTFRSKQALFTNTNGSPQKNNQSNALNLNPFANLQSDKELILDNRIIQRFFTYTLLDLYGKSFAETKQKSQYIPEFYMRSYTERSNKLKEYAKPILGTNEIAIYNNQTNLISRLSVKLDKDTHGYTTFPHGCRHILIEHKLYITGGVDQVKTKLNDVICYDLRDNTVERLNPLLTPHSYHSIEYLDNYDCLIVIGGEMNSTCEMFDFSTGNWTKLPELNFPRANVNVYYDHITSDLYALFGMENVMSENGSYSNVIEVLEMRDIAGGWAKVDYYKSADLNLKINYCTVLPFSKDTLLIYGGNTTRSQRKLFALFNMNKNEVLKIEDKALEEIKVEEKRMRNMDMALEKIK